LRRRRLRGQAGPHPVTVRPARRWTGSLITTQRTAWRLEAEATATSIVWRAFALHRYGA
jgi:hypothetical protein